MDYIDQLFLKYCCDFSSTNIEGGFDEKIEKNVFEVRCMHCCKDQWCNKQYYQFKRDVEKFITNQSTR